MEWSVEWHNPTGLLNNSKGYYMDPLKAFAAIKTGVAARKQLHNLSKEITAFSAYQELL